MVILLGRNPLKVLVLFSMSSEKASKNFSKNCVKISVLVYMTLKKCLVLFGRDSLISISITLLWKRQYYCLILTLKIVCNIVW